MNNPKVVRMDGSFFPQTPAPQEASSEQTSHISEVAKVKRLSDGGDNMDPKYATKDELYALDKEVASLSARVDGRFDTLDSKIDGKFDTMSEHIDAKFSALESRQTKWLIGPAVAIIALVVSLVELF